MGKPRNLVIVEPTIALDDVISMTFQEAQRALDDFCAANGFTDAERDDAFRLFRHATQQPGQAVTVPTVDDTSHTWRVHDCMQAITDSTAAAALAERAFDAAPGTHFEHSIRDDACLLTNVCTNAVP